MSILFFSSGQRLWSLGTRMGSRVIPKAFAHHGGQAEQAIDI
jgi:hypothetical protein